MYYSPSVFKIKYRSYSQVCISIVNMVNKQGHSRVCYFYKPDIMVYNILILDIVENTELFKYSNSNNIFWYGLFVLL